MISTAATIGFGAFPGALLEPMKSAAIALLTVDEGVSARQRTEAAGTPEERQRAAEAEQARRDAEFPEGYILPGPSTGVGGGGGGSRRPPRRPAPAPAPEPAPASDPDNLDDGVETPAPPTEANPDVSAPAETSAPEPPTPDATPPGGSVNRPDAS